MTEPAARTARRYGGLTDWFHPAVIAPALLALAAGFAQFLATATLADVATGFGVSEAGEDVPGLSGTTLGLGLAIIRFGSLAALPLTSRADRSGRRRLALIWTALGLSLTAAAALAPGYWWFVAVLALARPLLSATNAVALVIAAEVTRTRQRSKAISVVGAAYALGAGITVLIRSGASDQLGFRPIFAMALVPLLLVLLVARKLREPEVFDKVPEVTRTAHRLLAAPPPEIRRHLIIVCLLTAAAAFVTGPVNTFIFYFAETFRGLDPSVMAIGVLAAGPVGLAGLVMGRRIADEVGRRASSAFSLAALAASGMVTYLAPGHGVLTGYLLSMFFASVFLPPSGAISTELFPTHYRSTSAGWITACGVLGAVAGLALFGFLGDVFGNLSAAAVCVAVPVVIASPLYLMLPETRDRELDEAPAAPRPLAL